jgi:hypothetical protein
MKSRAHAIFGSIAMLCIFCFWTSTLVTELFMSKEAIVTVKGIILQAMWILIPAMVATGGSGFSLAKGRTGRLVDSKKKRMPFIAVNGLLVLLPSAFFLHSKALAGAFDASFYAICLYGKNLPDSTTFTRSPLGSGWRTMSMLKSMALMMPSPNSS